VGLLLLRNKRILKHTRKFKRFYIAKGTNKATKVWACGNTQLGQLGIGRPNVERQNTFVSIDSLSIPISHISCGGDHSVVIDKNGGFWGFGTSSFGQCGQIIEAQFVPHLAFEGGFIWSRCAKKHTILMNGKGEVFSLGSNQYGQLGYETNEEANIIPKKIDFPEPIRDVAVGSFHNLAISKDSSSIYAWGNNLYGQLGDNKMGNLSIPVRISKLIDSKYVKVAAGFSHSIALTTDGEIFVWGSNRQGQLGIPNVKATTTPIKLTIDELLNESEQIIDVSSGTAHNIAITDNGRIIAWGNNNYGEIGITASSSQNTPIVIKTFEKISSIACGGNHNLLFHNSELYGWGLSSDGQLSTLEGTTTPSLISQTPWKDKPILQIAAAEHHSLVLTTE